MGWRWVARAVCLLPVASGCGIIRPVTTEAYRGDAPWRWRRSCGLDVRKVWLANDFRHPKHEWADPFHGTFIDQSANDLDGGKQPLAVPPAKWAAKPQYFLPAGLSLSHDYRLRFSRTDAAAVSGNYSHRLKPVVLPDGGPTLSAGIVTIPGTPTVPYKPTVESPPMPALTPLPAARQLAPIPGRAKFDGLPTSSLFSELLSTLSEPLSTPAGPIGLPLSLDGPIKFTRPSVPADPDLLPIPTVSFPERMENPSPLPQGPNRPTGSSSILEDPPIVPFRFDPPGPPK